MTDASKNQSNPLGLWLVMDGRARFDTDDAMVYEVVCEGPRNNVPAKAARRMWSGHDAVLCFAPITGKDQCGVPEYVQDVDA